MLDDFFCDFNEFEVDSEIYRSRIGKFHLWDVLRTHCFFRIAQEKKIYDVSHRRNKVGLLGHIGNLGEDARSFHELSKRIRKGVDLLVLASTRRKFDASSGTWIDPYTDPLVDNLGSCPLVVEVRRGGVHHRPAWTSKTYYIDLLLYAVGLLTTLFGRLLVVSPEERRQLNSLESRLNQRFGTNLPLAKMAQTAYVKHTFSVAVYCWFLKRARIRTMVLVCAYGKEDWVDACRRLGIKTIELQHGTITPYHPGYHYPRGVDKNYVPDEFWGFGEYWTRVVQYPKRIRLRPRYGFPYLERELGMRDLTKDHNRLLVISQGIIGASLSKLLVDALAFLPRRIEIFYKLHPGESMGWKERYPWLGDRSDEIRVIEGDEPGLYDLMAKATWQMGVSSTALFEGMRFGCRTILVNLPSIEYMRPVLDSSQAVLVEKPDQLWTAMTSSAVPDGSVFFDRDDSMVEELKRLQAGHEAQHPVP